MGTSAIAQSSAHDAFDHKTVAIPKFKLEKGLTRTAKCEFNRETFFLEVRVGRRHVRTPSLNNVASGRGERSTQTTNWQRKV